MSDVLIGVEELQARLSHPQLRVADVRFDLGDTAKGERAYAEAHIPGAIYAHLDRDLSDHARTGLGRHPLPEVATFARWLGTIGYCREQSWVIYDDGNCAYAARLWWMLRLVGHTDVRVLDGGFAAWLVQGAPVTAVLPEIAATTVAVASNPDHAVDFAAVEQLRLDPAFKLVDARGAPRFRGDVEPLDPVAGHVPGAVNRPFTENLEASGLFKSPERLRAEWLNILGSVTPAQSVHMCGSGVTACQNLLAMEHAGLQGSRLFAPSWSGWISDGTRAVAQGEA